MFDQEDEGTRIGVVTALAITVLVLFGLIAGLVIRQIGGKAPSGAAVVTAGTGAGSVAAGMAGAAAAGVAGGVGAAGADAGANAGAVPEAGAGAGTTPTVGADVALLDEPIAGEIVGVLYFGLDSASLPAAAAAEIDKAKAALATASGKRLVLSGFHDPSGNADHNADLAKRRAVATREALLAAGVDAASVGLRKPEVTTGDGPAEQARRVEIRIAD